MMPLYVLSPHQISCVANVPCPLPLIVWPVKMGGTKTPGTVTSILGEPLFLRDSGPSGVVLLAVIVTVPFLV